MSSVREYREYREYVESAHRELMEQINGAVNTYNHRMAAAIQEFVDGEGSDVPAPSTAAIKERY